MGIRSVLTKIGGSLLATTLGAVAGAIAAVWYGISFWLPSRMETLTLEAGVFGFVIRSIVIIALAVLLFGLFGAILGGILGILVSQILILLRRKSK